MTVLVCPVCSGEMKEVSRDGILIDTCTRCRGVWLDRGELEKLSSFVERETPRSFLGSSRPPERREWRSHDDDDDDHKYRGSKPAKRKSFLDFFD